MSITRNLDKARAAWKKGDGKESIAAHKLSKSSALEEHKTSGQYIKSAVYGGLDGTVTTFAVVAGVAGASLNSSIVLIMGFANLVADGLSMAIGDYLSTKSEREYHAAEREREAWEVKNYPEGEKQELIDIYKDKGLPEKDAKIIVNTLSKHEKAWVDVMMVEELGIVENDESPLKNAFVTFISFAIFGFIPLAAYVAAAIIPFFELHTLLIACILTGLTLFTLGALKVKVTGKNWIYSGFEMLIIGGITATAAYGIGYLLAGI
ncbi:MAG: VIT1/CCC1 transporter family protein [Candidatus Woesearchaeota archaeon]|jgi:VIT1/CCC1 family predicted Fe2+/Mn2+ transporter